MTDDERLETMPVEELMARVLWGECRGGKDASLIAWVIKNRAAKPRWWGHDLRSVMLKPKQFSCLNPDDPNRAKLLAVDDSDPNFARCRAVARRVISGELRDPTLGATGYHAAYVHPGWADSMVETTRCGAHIFYREKTG